MLKKATSLVLTLGLLGGLAFGQCGTLPVPTAGGNGQAGYMFDVTNVSAGNVTVTGFSVHGLGVVAATMEIRTLNAPVSYLAAPNYAANLVTAANWTLQGTALTALTTALTPVPIVLNVVIPAGGTQAFYVTATTASLSYTSGGVAPNVVGGIIASDANLQVIGGNGKGYLAGPTFGGTFGGTTIGVSPGRLFRGAVHYSSGPLGSYEQNSAAASLDLNGLQSNGCNAANTVVCPGTAMGLNVGAASTARYDIAFNLASLVPNGGGAVVTGGGQIFNLDVGAGLNWFFTGNPIFWPNFAANYTLNFAAPILPSPGVSAQMIILSATHADGFELSQGLNFIGLVPPASIPGPVGDDVATSITAFGAPGCFPALALYGTSYTQYNVASNGRITMGPNLPALAPGGTSYWYSANPQVAGEAPFAGAWTDFANNNGGTVTINNTGSGIRADYTAVRYFNTLNLNTSTLSVGVSSLGDVVIDNFGLPLVFGASTDLNPQYIGVHPGGAVAIAGGVPVAPWGLGTVYGPGLPGDAVGVFGNESTLVTAGTLSINLTWSAAGYTLNVL